MLNENQINLLPERIYERLQKANTEYLESIGNVIKKIGELRPSDVHKLQQMYNYGADMDKAVKRLSDISGKNIREIYDIFDIFAKENYDYSQPFYKAKGMPFIPYEENESLQRYVKAAARQTVNDYINLTQHTAFAIFSADGKSIAPLFEANKNKLPTSLSDTYTKVVDYAVSKVQMGTESYQSAMREVIRSMADSGIRTREKTGTKVVDYATAYSRRLDTSVRQNILWGVKQCNQNTADLIGEEFGADGYEISYHSNPRPSHADMGGRQYAIGKGRTVNGVYYPPFSDVEQLLQDYNCLHFKFSILLGISRPAYSDEQLAKYKAMDKETFEFEGKTYTKYEASQLQRRIETKVRTEKDIANMAKAAGDDDLRREAQARINLLTSKYAKLSKESGLPTKMERMQVSGFRPVKVKEALTKGGNDGIIKSVKTISEVQDVHHIGKIDRNIYKCVTEDIKTDEVIITDTQIQHIKDRHPNDYEKYFKYAEEIIKHPNYIIEANKPYTALILKEIETENEKFKTILRLSTSIDSPEYKNSIITFMKIDDKEWKRIIKNKKTLYKSE